MGMHRMRLCCPKELVRKGLEAGGRSGDAGWLDSCTQLFPPVEDRKL